MTLFTNAEIMDRRALRDGSNRLLFAQVTTGQHFLCEDGLKRVVSHLEADAAKLRAPRRKPKPPALNPFQIGYLTKLIERASTLTGVATEALLGNDRDGILVRIRSAIVFVARQGGYSSARIGRVMHRDHTTILASEARAVSLMGDKAFAKLCKELSR